MTTDPNALDIDDLEVEWNPVFDPDQVPLEVWVPEDVRGR